MSNNTNDVIIIPCPMRNYIPQISVVTCFFDVIEWNDCFGQSFDDCQKDFITLLSCPVDMTIYTEKKYQKLIEAVRIASTPNYNTAIVVETMDHLKTAMYQLTISDIQEKHRDGYPWSIEKVKSPLYNIIYGNKMDWMTRVAVNVDFFSSSPYLIWMDFTCFQNQDLLQQTKIWNIILQFQNTIDGCSICPSTQWSNTPYNPRQLFLQSSHRLQGNLFGLYRIQVKSFAEMFYRFMEEIFLEHGISDDDNYFFTLFHTQYPHLFCIHHIE